MADDAHIEMLQKLEDFFASPKFTSALGQFLGEKAPALEYKPLDEDQPLSNYDTFKEYTQMVEQQLEEFLVLEGFTAQAIFEACVKAQQAQDGSWLTCIDYLIASTEYESFMELAYDHFCMGAYEPNDVTAWDAGEVDEEAGEEGKAGITMEGAEMREQAVAGTGA